MSGLSERDARIIRLAAALLETDALTANDGETLHPDHYIVDADNVPYLVSTVLDLANVRAHIWALAKERDEAKAEALAPIRALAEKWSGCWCDTQMAHDHDPRVQDCPQHGDSSCQHMAEGITVDLRALLDGGDQ